MGIMDKREAREYLGTNHHFNQHMNVIPGAQPPKKKWGITGATPSLPMRIRQNSVSSDTSSSPVGSPIDAPDYSNLERRNSKTLYNSFGFAN